MSLMTAIPPDYDSDPERWRSWKSPRDAHDMLSAELRGPVLDMGGGVSPRPGGAEPRGRQVLPSGDSRRVPGLLPPQPHSGGSGRGDRAAPVADQAGRARERHEELNDCPPRAPSRSVLSVQGWA